MADTAFLVFLFARSTDVCKGKGALVESAFNNFKKMYDVCDTHASREYHKGAVATCEAFVQVMSGRQESVAVQLREGARETIQNNRKKLQSIIETITLCVWQNIPLRGHRDSSTNLEGPQSDSTNHGNFWTLLNFRICAGDTFLKDHLHSAARLLEMPCTRLRISRTSLSRFSETKFVTRS